MKIGGSKHVLRKEIVEAKKQFSAEQLCDFSNEVIQTLELTSLFQQAQNVLSYYSLGDEVDTHQLMSDYAHSKRFVLPVVKGEELLLKEFRLGQKMKKGALGISEPEGGDEFVDFDSIDLIIVPGVAFDRKLNRLGRGKGYYDRLLSQLKSPKIGICFDFQLLESIPVEDWDIKMDMIVAQNEIVIG